MFGYISKKQIQEVRAKIIGLCLEPGQYLKVASGKFEIPYVKISVVNAQPVFEYGEMGKGVGNRFYLTNENKWLWGAPGDFPETHLSFNDKIATIPRNLIKAYARHFPFVATDNYFVKEGVVA